jgi:CRP/FNR family transcriptional regulator
VDVFRRFMADNSSIEHRLLTMASNELAAAQEQMLVLGRKTAIERVASFLLSLSERHAGRGRAATPLHLPMARGEIADYLGLTIETVSRAFTRLRTDGLISLAAVDLVELVHIGGLRDLSMGER